MDDRGRFVGCRRDTGDVGGARADHAGAGDTAVLAGGVPDAYGGADVRRDHGPVAAGAPQPREVRLTFAAHHGAAQADRTRHSQPDSAAATRLPHRGHPLQQVQTGSPIHHRSKVPAIQKFNNKK